MKLTLTIEAWHDYGAQTFHAVPILKDGKLIVDGWEGGLISGNFTSSDQAFFDSVFGVNAARALSRLNRLPFANAFQALANGKPVELISRAYRNNIHVDVLLDNLEE